MKPTKEGPLVLGIIGGSGTGKTHFADYLNQQLDGHFVEGDVIGHHALLKPEVIQAIKARYGSGVIKQEGIVDRQALGAIVFSDQEALKDLNTIMHPKMYRMIEKEIQVTDKDFVVLEAAVMIEAGFHRLVDVMFCIIADEEVRLQRLVTKRQIDESRARRMIEAGRQDCEKYGDYIIDTTLDMAVIKDEIDRIIAGLRHIPGTEH